MQAVVKVDERSVEGVLVWLAENTNSAWPDGEHPMDNLSKTMEVVRIPDNGYLIYDGGIIYMEDAALIDDGLAMSIPEFKDKILKLIS